MGKIFGISNLPVSTFHKTIVAQNPVPRPREVKCLSKYYYNSIEESNRNLLRSAFRVIRSSRYCVHR